MELKFYRSTTKPATHHHVLWWDWNFRPPSGTIRQGFHIPTTPPVPGIATSVAEVVWGPIRHMQLTLPFQLFRHHHVLRWIGTSDPPSGTIRQGFHIQTTHTCPRDATSVAHVVQGLIRHMQLKFYRHSIVPPPPPCAAVGLALQIPPLVPSRQGFPTLHTTPSSEQTSVADMVQGLIRQYAAVKF
jgi:hypothetical protein